MKQEPKKQKLHQKLLSGGVSLLLIVAVCLCLFIVVQVLSHGHASLGGYSCFKVITGSMEPELSVGDLILTEKTEAADIEVNDIVSFYSQAPGMIGNIITHRVVDKIVDEDGTVRLLTKGDANLSMDGYAVTDDNLIGKVIWESGDSLLSDFLSFLSNKYGFLACIAFPALLISILILRDNVGAMKRDMKELVEELEKKETNPSSEDEDNRDGDEETYAQMCDRIRAELMEELKNSDTSEPSEPE
ncbi:MAG: signal peptidase I [Ruminococcaceae bacterium]|nr:signal peptidase I [Oscillospiraceae bacterium]